ncbi:hypothetical protein [Cohnella nanjingensis]|uniref:Uncharacterized protein n=1 Tax=Cohnella nanjingensis TaxID=1387779 RepID=A0A7X0VF57_9BACL|nr:hypothetical protein [Cohnella nanjingensis]MBB6670269.1 hypothetical protein [Cohnella nanjingensis]
METQYLAITKFGTTKEAPFAVARLHEGLFERYVDDRWVEDISLADILIGEFSDYEEISEEEANRIINQ